MSWLTSAVGLSQEQGSCRRGGGKRRHLPTEMIPKILKRANFNQLKNISLELNIDESAFFFQSYY